MSMKNTDTAAAKSLSAAIDGRREMITVFIIALLSRLFMFAISFAALRLSGNGRTLAEIFPPAGDVPHYLYIAEHWYTNVGEKANLLVFYPLFPMLIAVFRVVIRSYFWSGIIISYLSFSIGACYFYKLLRLDYDKEKTAYGMAGFFAALFGVFFISAHTESLFVMLLAMTLYYTRKKNWLAVGIIGFCAALSKTQGVLLLLPAAYEIIIDAIKNKSFSKKSLFVLLIPLGFFSYLLLNYIISGNFFKFVEYQSVAPWYNTSTWISNSISTSYNMAMEHFSLSLIMYWPQIILFFVAIAAIFYGVYKKVPTLYLIFIGAYTGMTYFQSWMLSGGRYISTCLPIYIVYASIDNKYAKNLILLATGMLCFHIAVMWFQGQAIM